MSLEQTRLTYEQRRLVSLFVTNSLEITFDSISPSPSSWSLAAVSEQNVNVKTHSLELEEVEVSFALDSKLKTEHEG